ncbi:MAG: polyphosphate kinase 2, partial [Planctomycetales bacterium]|nr:polyphosphate kinase 2 [Planctomycetales bacterium]
MAKAPQKQGEKVSGAAKSPTPRSNGRPRRASQGDISPKLTPAGIENYVVDQASTAAREAKINAVRDVVGTVPPHDVDTLARVMEALMSGVSPDDAVALRNALLQNSELIATKLPANADDVLSDDWRDGGYPYKNLLSRKNYEKLKYRLQVELLKLQSWVKKNGEKLV